MEYQLVLQFSGDSFDDFDHIVTLEDKLIEALGCDADVDGHDIGSDQVNIFIFTSEPEIAFETAKQIIEHAGLIKTTIAAYRETDGEKYNVIWPKGSNHNFEIT